MYNGVPFFGLPQDCSSRVEVKHTNKNIKRADQTVKKLQETQLLTTPVRRSLDRVGQFKHFYVFICGL